MKNVLFLSMIFVLLSACSKEEQIMNSTANKASNNQTVKVPDVVYHYKGKEYPLYLVKGSTEEFVQDENTKALDELTSSNGGFVTFTFSDKPANHYYLFDSEFNGYDYVEKNGKPMLGRKFKIAYRIDELRDKLLGKYGKDINYNNHAVYAEALAGVEAIYAELKIKGDLPRDLEGLIGKKEENGTPRSGPLMKVFEHSNYTGSEMNVQTAPESVTWTHGPWNCWRTTANPDLTLEYQPNSNNWNDCISSVCINGQSGADAVVYGYYKDSYYATYSCSKRLDLVYSYQIGSDEWCTSLTNYYWSPGVCGHMNDQISSIRIKVFWSSCSIDVDDM